VASEVREVTVARLVVLVPAQTVVEQTVAQVAQEPVRMQAVS